MVFFLLIFILCLWIMIFITQVWNWISLELQIVLGSCVLNFNWWEKFSYFPKSWYRLFHHSFCSYRVHVKPQTNGDTLTLTPVWFGYDCSRHCGVLCQVTSESYCSCKGLFTEMPSSLIGLSLSSRDSHSRPICNCVIKELVKVLMQGRDMRTMNSRNPGLVNASPSFQRFLQKFCVHAVICIRCSQMGLSFSCS